MSLSTHSHTDAAFCVYITIYTGTKLPPFYIGSSTTVKVLGGYHGSILSKEFRVRWKAEIVACPDKFRTFVIAVFNDRRSALEYENLLQRKYNVVKSPLFVNKAFAAVNGFFGMNVSGERNPMYGKKRPDISDRNRSINAGMAARVSATRIRNGTAAGSKNPMYGKSRPDAAERMRQMNRRMNCGPAKREEMRRTVCCLHCRHVGQMGGMRRWHLDRCKSVL